MDKWGRVIIMKLFFYDLETTGVNHKACGVHQLSGQLITENNNELSEVRHKVNIKMRPHKCCFIHPKALEVCNITEEQIMAYPSMENGFMDLKAFLSKHIDKYDKTDKAFLVGYNINAFDNFFLRDLFTRNNDIYFGSWFYSNTIDLYPIASHKFRNKRNNIKSFKLSELCADIGIEVDNEKTHEAQYDVELCIKLYDFLK